MIPETSCGPAHSGARSLLLSVFCSVSCPCGRGRVADGRRLSDRSVPMGRVRPSLVFLQRANTAAFAAPSWRRPAGPSSSRRSRTLSLVPLPRSCSAPTHTVDVRLSSARATSPFPISTTQRDGARSMISCLASPAPDACVRLPRAPRTAHGHGRSSSHRNLSNGTHEYQGCVHRRRSTARGHALNEVGA
ncbi:hypothetical protein BV20DRAFT_666992 [Pilatotrama ljubarskyi]|nr:hypothetical protein BV20DRAFT_666992 [Pilatotrama ljubarskyi]